MASEAKPLYCRPTRHGVFRRMDLRILIEESLNIIEIVCEAKTGGGEGAPTTCYTISIDYVMLRYSRNKGCFCTFGAVSVIAPVGLWGRKWSSLLAFGEKRRKTEVSTPLLCYRAERVWKAGGLRSERSGERQTSGSALPH